MAKKPGIPKGTRDFTPTEISRRNYIIGKIREQFQQFGFQPIETPAFENLETLMGKYGEEGDRLIFKILNSGSYLNKIDNEFFERYFKIEKLVDQIIEIFTTNQNARYNFETGQSKGLVDFAQSLLSQGDLDYIDDYSKYFSLRILLQKIYQLCEESDYGINKDYLSLGRNLLIIEYRQLFLRNQSTRISTRISEKALRYDLTVPFARYVVMHQNEIDFPFKRYQIQPVWRADRPQRGRFREFYQCDADVVGPKSLLQEVEFIQLYDKVFSELNLDDVVIKLNNRKILSGIVEAIGTDPKLITAFLIALDKIDKIGADGVKLEMIKKGISREAIAKAEEHLFQISGDYHSQMATLREFLKDSEVGQEGLDEVDYITNTISEIGLKTSKLSLDVTLARGLNYYTGSIFEVAADGVKMGSIGGGGRYDDLTGIFGMPGTSGVGISFGLERIYLVLEQLNLFPQSLERDLDVLCLNFGGHESIAALKLITAFREAGLKADLYPVSAKIQKQMKYANNRKVPFVVLLGATELEAGTFVVKDMEKGIQKTFELGDPGLFLESI